MKLKKLVLLVIGVVFIMLVFPSCNNDNIIVTYDYNKSPNTVNILSDNDIGRTLKLPPKKLVKKMKQFQ